MSNEGFFKQAAATVRGRRVGGKERSSIVELQRDCVETVRKFCQPELVSWPDKGDISKSFEGGKNRLQHSSTIVTENGDSSVLMHNVISAIAENTPPSNSAEKGENQPSLKSILKHNKRPEESDRHISFGGLLSSELFDKTLHVNTPVRKESSPKVTQSVKHSVLSAEAKQFKPLLMHNKMRSKQDEDYKESAASKVNSDDDDEISTPTGIGDDSEQSATGSSDETSCLSTITCEDRAGPEREQSMRSEHEPDCTAVLCERKSELGAGNSEQTAAGQSVTVSDVSASACQDHEDKTMCQMCLKPVDGKVNRCAGCHVAKYCSRECQLNGWNDHKILCKSIRTLEDQQEKQCDERCKFSTMSPNKEKKIAQLIGKKCTVNVEIGGMATKALWDTGAQISLVSTKWLQNNVPDYISEDIHKLLGTEMSIEAAGGGKIPYSGYTVLPVKLADRTPINVPFLIAKQTLREPIIGYNVISTISQEKLLPCEAFPDMDPQDVVTLSTLVLNEENDHLATVKSNKFACVIRAGATISIPCKIKTLHLQRTIPVLFQPSMDNSLDELLSFKETIVTLKQGARSRIFLVVENQGMHDITIPGRATLGTLQLIKSAIPAEVSFKEFEENGKGIDKSVDVSAGASVGTSAGRDETVKVESMTADCEETASLETDQGGQQVCEDDEKYRQQLLKVELKDLNCDQQKAVKEMLWEERHVFIMDENDVGDTDLQLDIKTTDEVPVQKAYNNIPKPLYEEVKTHIHDLANRGWIKKSRSPWSSPVVIVRKKDGGIRLCCDFRALNKKTIPDKHPLPRIQSALENMGGSQWFSALDQSRAYYQGKMNEETRHKTAFITPWGLWEWVRIPFGLMNAPAGFQRHMEETFEDYRDDFALPYLDDVIVYSKTFDEHVHHIQLVFQRIKKKGLKLNPAKCDIFRNEVKYLGRIVGKDGYRMDTDAIEAVLKLKHTVPKNVGEVRSILGLLGYHRRHIQDFARLAKPLSDLLQTAYQNKPEQSNQPKNGVTSKMPVEWTDKHREALDNLITLVTTAPILAYPDYTKKFFIHTDASQHGLGCILYQQSSEKDTQVIAYGSRTLLPAEKRYHSTKLEFLALRWAVTEKFHEFLAYANDFEVYTDNNPLLYIMESSKLNANGQRWVSALSEYNFRIKYRPGIINKDADCLSRLPLDISTYIDECKEEVSTDAFRAIMMGIEVQIMDDESWKLQTSVASLEVDELFKSEPTITTGELQRMQKEDTDIKPVIDMMMKGGRIPKEQLTRRVKILLRSRKKLFFDDEGLLRRRSQEAEQLVLPNCLRHLVYEELHQNMGHLGSERTFALAKQRVFWPGMLLDIEEFVRERCPCIARKKPSVKQYAPMQSIITSAPLELLAVDYVHLENSSAGHEYILVITDHFTRYTQAYPTKNKSSVTAAKHLYDDFIFRFGAPTKLLSDQGREFDNNLFKEVEKLAGIKKIRTTPYHPQTNGLVERMNETILQMLRTLDVTEKSKWHKSLAKVVFAYNATKHKSTGYSPFHLMFGRHPRLPLDSFLQVPDVKKQKIYSKYAEEWKVQMEKAYNIANERSAVRKAYDRKRVDNSHVRLANTLEIGDRVLVRNMETGGPGKLRSYWKEEVYVIDQVKENGVVYTVLKEKDRTGRWTVHRNMILPCEKLKLADKTSDVETTKNDRDTKPRRSKRIASKTQLTRPTVPDVSFEESSSVKHDGKPRKSTTLLPTVPEQLTEDSSSDEDDYAGLPVVVPTELSSRNEDFSEGKRNEDLQHNVLLNGNDKILGLENDNCTESLDPTQEHLQNGSAKTISEEEYNDMFSQTQDTDLQHNALNVNDKILGLENDNGTESLDPTQKHLQSGSAKTICEEEYNDMFSQTHDTDFHGFSEIDDNDQLRPDIKENVQNTPEGDSQTNADQSHLECNTPKNQRDESFQKRLKSIEAIDDEINRSVSERKEVESNIAEMLDKWRSRSTEPMTSTPVLRRSTRLTPSLQ